MVIEPATPETCPHEISGETAQHYRRARPDEEPEIVSICVRCETRVYAVHKERQED